MDLKYRKAIANGVLLDDAMQKLKIQNMSTNPGGALNLAGGLEPKLTTSASGLGSLGSGGMGSLAEKDPTKFFGLDGTSEVAKSGGAGTFLKNNAGGIANAAMSALNFASTIGGLSKNTMTADEMMGSGGQVENNANGIGYTELRVDDAGILKQIDATASAATMTGALSGAALGGSIGTIFGPLGTGIGTLAGGLLGGVAGFFGGKSAKREAERLKEIAIARTQAANTQNREQAYTIGLRNEFNRENRTGTSQSLFHAALGKEKLKVNPVTGKTFLNTLIYTSHGPAIGPQGGWGTKGEVIADDLGYGYEIPTGPNDTAKIDADEGGSIYSLHVENPSTGNSVAHDAKILLKAGNGKMSISDKNWLDMNLQVGRMMMYAGKRKMNTNTGYLGGTLKKFDLGRENITDIWNKEADTLANNWYLPTNTNNLPKPAPVIASRPQVTTNTTTTTNTGTSGSKTPGFLSKLWGSIKNAGSGLDFGNILTTADAFATAEQRKARAEGLRAPKSFVDNPYRRKALDELDRLQSDYYSVWAGNREKEAAGKSSIMQSGGLSAGQKMLGFMGLTNQTQQNNMAALFEHLNRQNALRAQAANAKLQAGEQMATRQQQAYQWDEDMLAKAHSAQDNKWETSAYDIQNALALYFKNRWEKNQFDRTMGLYESNQKNDAEKTKAIIESLRNNKNNPVTLTGVADNAAMISIDPETGALRRIDPFSPKLLGPGLKNPSVGFKFPTMTPSAKRRSAAKRTKKGK